MGECPFDISQVPQGPDRPGVKWPLGTRYLSTSVTRCRFHHLCGVERPGLVMVLSDKRPKPNSVKEHEDYWWTLCPEHYADAGYLPDWPNP